LDGINGGAENGVFVPEPGFSDPRLGTLHFPGIAVPLLDRTIDRLPPREAAFAALVVTAAMWGSNAVVARSLLDGISAVWLASLRWIVVLVMLTPLVWKERRAIVSALRTHFRELAMFAVLGFAPQNLLVYAGLSGTTAINMGLLNSAIPVLIVVIVAAMRRRLPGAFVLMGLAISVTGVLLLVAHGDPRAVLRLDFNAFDLVVLVGMFIWAMYTIKLGERALPLSFPAFCYAAGLIGVVMMLPAIGWDLAVHGAPRPSTGTLAGVLYLGALPTLAAMLLYGYAVNRVGAVQAGIFTHLVPVFTAIFATLLLGEHLHAFHAAGFALIASGAILCCMTPSPMLSSRADVPAA
jgi:drug/metabolite transporter (DMT)-like permease